MVEYDLMQIIQMVSWVATALGVCVAATYYVMTLRNTDKTRRKEMMMQRLPSFNQEYYNAYFTVMSKMIDWNNLDELFNKYGAYTNPDAWSKIVYLLNCYNTVGTLWLEKVANLDEILKLYSPVAIISLYERFEPIMKRNLAVYGFDFYEPLKLLYVEVKTKYPNTPSSSRSLDESLERTMAAQEKMKTLK